jgi:hypothetical protein
MRFFSLVQCLGYVACALGVTAFLQKKDTRLKGFLAAECAVYTVHFWLLGNPPAALSAFLSGCRSGLAIRHRHWLMAAVFVALNVGLGILFAHRWTAVLPIVGGVLGTVAILTMMGTPMRVVLLISTLCWLANNCLTGSVGGMMLESFNALANGFTLARLLTETRKAAAISSASPLKKREQSVPAAQ